MSSRLIFTRLLQSLHVAFPSAWSNTNNQDQIGIIYLLQLQELRLDGVARKNDPTSHLVYRTFIAAIESSSCSCLNLVVYSFSVQD
jgi:hypothetical protein